MALQDDQSCGAFFAERRFFRGFWEDIGGFRKDISGFEAFIGGFIDFIGGFH
jgi:hypothetical protein